MGTRLEITLLIACGALLVGEAAVSAAPNAVVASAADTYLATEPSLGTRRMVQLAPGSHAQFVEQWSAGHEQDLRRLRAARQRGAGGEFFEREKARLDFRHVQGRVMFPFFHWRESEAPAIVPDPAVARLVRALPLNEARWWDLREYREFLDAYVHALARERLQTEVALRSGDNRWLRAKFQVTEAVLRNPQLRVQALAELLARHIDDDGSRDIEPMLERWISMQPDAASVQRVRTAIEADRAHAIGLQAPVYREVSGVPLHLYMLEPQARPRGDARPAMLWLHGGSATEGIWWHSAGMARTLLDAGVMVVAVELTTGNRFDTDSDQNADAAAAFEYVRDHAARLGIDPRRIGVAGFSSGASVALLMATRGAAPTAEGSGMSPRFPRPDAVIVSGACADPLSDREDGYFRKSMAKFANPADFSPYAQLRSGLPPLLSVHATEDEFCAYADMSRFAERYGLLGNEATLRSVQGAGHFFVYNHPVGKQQLREAIVAALQRWGW